MKNLKLWASAIFFSAAAAVAPAQVLYQNTTTDTGTVLTMTNGQQVGDQIYLANYLTYPYLTGFSLEFWSSDAIFTGGVQMDVRFYLNDGTTYHGYNTPGTLFYDTGLFSILTPQQYASQNSAVLSFSLADLQGGVVPLDPNFQMPANFTVAVTFSNLAISDQVGLNNFAPPAVGANAGDYWLNNAGSWELLTNETTVAFAMQLDATNTPTPEPGTLCLFAAGSALLAGYARRRRQ